MLSYRECNIDDFNNALKQKHDDVKTISDEYLYILYTKFEADARQCSGVHSSYATGLNISSKKQAKIYKEELLKRGISIK